MPPAIPPATSVGRAWTIATLVAVGATAVAASLVWRPLDGHAAAAAGCFVANWRTAPPGEVTQRTASPFTTLLEHDPDRLRVVDLPSGRRALAISVEPTDDDPDGTTQRTELAAPGVRYRPGEELWLATTVLIPRGFAFPSRDGWALLAQLFGESGGASTGSPPLAVELTPDRRFRLTVRGGAKPDSSSPAPHEARRALGRASTGRWHRFLIHVRLERGPDGVVEAWQEPGRRPFGAAPAATDRGPNVLTVDGVPQAVFPEVGYYRSADARTATLYTTGLAVCPDRARAERFVNG